MFKAASTLLAMKPYDRSSIHTNSTEPNSIIDSWRKRGKHPVQRRDTESSRVHKQEVDEELGHIHIQLGHEIDNDCERYDHAEDSREIHNHTGNGHSGRTVESIILVTGDDCSSGNSRHQFGQLQPSQEQNGEEQSTATSESTTCIEGLAIEQGRDN